MMGLDKMLAQMIGMTPEQMRTQMQGFAAAANEGVEILRRVDTNFADIKARLERIENGDGNR